MPYHYAPSSEACKYVYSVMPESREILSKHGKSKGLVKICSYLSMKGLSRKKVGMIFSSNLDGRKVNPLIYVKYWRQVSLPKLLYGAKLFMLSSGGKSAYPSCCMVLSFLPLFLLYC